MRSMWCLFVAVTWSLLAVVLACVATPAPLTGETGRAVPDRPALQNSIDAMVVELLEKRNQGAKGVRDTRPIRLEGIAWESRHDVSAGTSRLGLALDNAVERSLEHRKIEVSAGAAGGSKGIAGTILRGAYKLLKGGVGLSLSLIDANSGSLIAETRRILSGAALAGLSRADLLPPDPQSAETLVGFIRQAIGESPSAFPIQVLAEKGTHAAYFPGERLHLIFEASRDCYLRLYHISWKEKAFTLLFPNRSEPNSFIPAGVPRRIPDDSAGAEFVVAPPYGVDAIVAVASTVPFQDDAWVAGELGSGNPDDASPGEPGLGNPVDSPTGGVPYTGGDTLSVPGEVSVSGDFLTESGIDEDRARGILAKGLLVRHREPPTTSGTSETDPSGSYAEPTPSVPEAQPDIAPDPYSQPTQPQLARAVCYFTTLPEPAVRR